MILSDEIKVKYGMYDFRLQEEPALHSLEYIMTDLKDIKQAYFKLGFHLNEFNTCRYYENLGFLTFKEFCIANIPLEFSMISRCISVFKMVCQYNSNVPTMFMKDKYKEFGYSQLCEMVSIKDEDYRNMVTPSMTIKQIRDMKKGKMSSCDVATDKKVDVGSAKKNYSSLYMAFDEGRYDDVMIHFKNYLAVELGQLMEERASSGKCVTFKFKDKQYKLQLSVMKGV